MTNVLPSQSSGCFDFLVVLLFLGLAKISIDLATCKSCKLTPTAHIIREMYNECKSHVSLYYMGSPTEKPVQKRFTRIIALLPLLPVHLVRFARREPFSYLHYLFPSAFMALHSLFR